MSTNQAVPQLHIDPFFDGEAPGLERRVSTPGYHDDLAGRQAALAPAAPYQESPNQRGTTNAGVSNLAGYRDVRDMTLADGRPMMAVMRSGPDGLAGTVIPHAGLGGVPQGVNIHRPQDLEVNIDPHMQGQRSRVHLGDVARHLQAAQQMAASVTPEPYSIETLRLRGAATMHGIAQLSTRQQAPAEYDRAQPQYAPDAPNIPAPHQAQWAGQGASQHVGGGMHQGPRNVRPLQSFAQQAAAGVEGYAGRELRAIDLSQSPKPVERRRDPTFEVVFEIERFGSHTANYHDVIVRPGFIVLIYDSACPGRLYAPPAGDDSPPMAISISGDSQVYLVHATGIQYAYEGREFCILLVERSAQARQDFEDDVPLETIN